MNDKQEKINKDLLTRIERLEKIALKGGTPHISTRAAGKVLSLPELIKGHDLSNGQEKITAIVGYLEKIRGKNPIKATDIKQGWREGKFDGGFANVLITRAIKDGLIADYENNGNYVLTQGGEKFWDELVK